MDIPGDDYDDATNRGDAEGHLEFYYNLHLNDNVAISPDYQLVWDPNGEDRDPINIFGLRTQIDF
jgi:carbohydrate-selective porin OprB